jgi:antitoxin VapB
MALYIKDPDVDALVEKLQGMMATTKTEAVKAAVEEKIAREEKELSLLEKVEALRAELNAMFGEPDPNFNFKKFRDEMWGNI